jgi:hypothetical protein
MASLSFSLIIPTIYKYIDSRFSKLLLAKTSRNEQFAKKQKLKDHYPTLFPTNNIYPETSGKPFFP